MSNLKLFNQFITREDTQGYLEKTLGYKKSSFINNAVALVSNVEKLQKCDPKTIMFACIKATALDLPLDQNLGFAYVIPYGELAQFQIGYKGIIQLAQRSGQMQTINVRDVREGEIEEEDFVSGEMKFKQITKDRENTKIIGYVGYFKLLNGFYKSLYMTTAQLQQHGKKYSKFYSGVWTENFDAMAQKTVLKLLLNKYAPLSVEMQDAIRSDQAVFRKDLETPEYIDVPTSDNELSEEQTQLLETIRETKGLTKAQIKVLENKTNENLLDEVKEFLQKQDSKEKEQQNETKKTKENGEKQAEQKGTDGKLGI